MTSIGDSIAQALADGRASAEARMTETVAVGLYADDVDSNGNATRTLLVERYAGIGRIKLETLAVSDRSEPDQAFVEQDPLLGIPTSSPALHEGDEVLVIASTADPSLVGRRYRIAGTPQAGQTTAHRYPMKETT